MGKQQQVAALKALFGDDVILDSAEDCETYRRDITGRWPAHAIAVARPRDTAEAAAIVRQAVEQGLAIVPQGGNTGLVGGCAAPAERPALLLSLRRMNRVRLIDTDAAVIVVEAGCILADVQAAAADRGFAIPLGLGSEGSATIGGLVSTNAGGVRALRHGVMRAQVFGLEAVLPDGRVWDGLRRVAKNNMGYDLKQLFIGGEGTLGVVTAVALRMVPAWRQVETAWLAVESPAAALSLLHRLRASLGDLVVAFELVQRRGCEWALRRNPALRMPDMGEHGWFVLAEFASSASDHPIRAAVEQAIADGFDGGLVQDGTLAENETQRRELWRIRETVVEGKIAQKPSVSVDVAVPLGQVPAFIDRATAVADHLLPGSECLSVGHIGDGNIHFSVHRGANVPASLTAAGQSISEAIETVVLGLGGSICAEHGVGRSMRDSVANAVSDVERDLFRAVKRVFDPANRMNPGALVQIDDQDGGGGG
ncbi:MAG: FAD-binding oxidoreductase [Sphingopyxis sp.]|uniref:FAD-binding oxidoreductase n=1 Tax=Sphingopyxis sp. TaxID=1908224 RepID=UPI002AB92941|nr:FAD-binding oxidoreductase [Sphingopyxis sp.]MDZ3832841.1 FAD-binding oxidoreductase [Sphingopyxis sp.]